MTKLHTITNHGPSQIEVTHFGVTTILEAGAEVHTGMRPEVIRTVGDGSASFEVTPDKYERAPPDMAAVGRRVSEWANSPAGRKAIMEEPDGSCEAGVLHPEAPLNRFVIDHGVLHDTLIGRHVIGCRDSIATESVEKLRDYLISLTHR